MYGHKSYASIISLQWPQIIWIRYDVPQLELIKSDETRVHMNTGITGITGITGTTSEYSKIQY